MLREARDWFLREFNPETFTEFVALVSGTRNASFRMVLGYWDMAASFVTGGVMHEGLFTQNSRELLLVWERIRDVVPGLRETFKNSNLSRNLETVANAMIADRLPDSAFGV